MTATPRPHSDESRFIDCLRHVGYTTAGEPDPHGWRLAVHAFGPPFCFQAGTDFLRIHAEYSAGTDDEQSHPGLLEVVNRLNASQWFVRCTAVTTPKERGALAAVRLQANVPLGLSATELGECLFAWLQESAHVERAVDRHRWINVHDTIDPGPAENTR